MAFAAISGGTATNSSSANQTSASITPDQTYNVGNLCVLVIAVDNNNTTDADEGAVTGVTDTSGNIWVKAREYTNAQGGAQAGATCSIWFSTLAFSITTGSTITATFSNNASRDKSAISLKGFTMAANKFGRPDWGNQLANDGADPGSLDVTTSNVAALRIRGIASESNATTALTVTGGGWAALSQSVTTGGGGAANMGVRGEWKISTGTTDASDPTLFNADHVSVYVAFVEADFSATVRSFRFYADGTESGSTALAAESTNYTADISTGDVIIQARFRLLNNSFFVAGQPTDDYQLYMSKNSGGYALASTEIIGFDSSSLTEGQATTQRLSADIGTFVAGKVTEDLEVNDFSLGVNNTGAALIMTEFVFSIKVVATAVISGDTYDLRPYINNVALGYNVTPRITITGTYTPGGRRVFIVS